SSASTSPAFAAASSAAFCAASSRSFAICCALRFSAISSSFFAFRASMPFSASASCACNSSTLGVFLSSLSSLMVASSRCLPLRGGMSQSSAPERQRLQPLHLFQRQLHESAVQLQLRESLRAQSAVKEQLGPRRPERRTDELGVLLLQPFVVAQPAIHGA